MPLAGLMPRFFLGLGAAVLAAFGAASAWSQSNTARMPREIRFGAVDMVIQRVEPEVSRAEILAAVQAQLDRETMCFPWPSVWLDPAERRRVFVVRFDLMTRDWGVETAEAARTRMQEFVAMGLVTQRAMPRVGADAVEFRLTPLGDAHLQGSLSSGRLSFCMPSGRRVQEITETEFGDFACGTLKVRFTHVADAWPNWARTEFAQTRIAETWAPLGSSAPGSVSMSRQWFSDDPPDGRGNGELRSLCYDSRERAVSGDDMELAAATP